MSIQKIDHIAIAVSDLAASIAYHRDVLGLVLGGTERIEYLHVEVAFFACGDTEIELVCPTSPDSKVQRYMDRHGEGLYHIAYRVDDAAETLRDVTSKGIVPRDKAPKPGAGGSTVAFLDEKSTGGVITELVQKPSALPNAK